jgi:DNA polymerase-3 subunit delta
MIIKSYILENDPKKTFNEKSILFYGVNIGLKRHFKNIFKRYDKESLIKDFNQEELIKNKNILYSEIDNPSLFSEGKLIFIEGATEKIFSILEPVIDELKNNKVIIFADALDKRSKLRSYYEKSKTAIAVACYEDNEITIKKIITNKLKDFRGLSNENINLIIDNCGLDRVKLENELSKINSYFNNKLVERDKLEALLNLKSNDNFNSLKDAAIEGNKVKTNKLLSDTVLDPEKNILYLNIINQRLNRLYEVVDHSKNTNIDDKLTNLKPPLFWKDKPIFISQMKKWNKKKIKEILSKCYDLEISIKSNTVINKNILLKKLLLDICEQANPS